MKFITDFNARRLSISSGNPFNRVFGGFSLIFLLIFLYFFLFVLSSSFMFFIFIFQNLFFPYTLVKLSKKTYISFLNIFKIAHIILHYFFT